MKFQHRVFAVLAMIVAAAALTLLTATPAYALSKGDSTYDIIVMALTVYIIVSPLVIVALIVLLVRASKKAKNAQRDAVILPSAQRAQTVMQVSPYDDPYVDAAPSFQPADHQQHTVVQQHAAHPSAHGRISEPAQPQQRPQHPQQQQQTHPSTAQQHAKMKQAQAQHRAQSRVAQQQAQQQGQARPKIHIDPNGAQGRRRQQ